MRTVWIVSEGSPGHVSQSVGLVDALSKHLELNVIQVGARTKVRGWQRHLIRYCMGRQGYPLPEWLLRRVADIHVPPEAPTPDLLVSSGGKSVFASVTWARRFHIPNIFIGERKPYPAEWFHTAISPVESEIAENTIPIELIPTPAFIEESKGNSNSTPRIWCMIIGGASRSHHYDDRDWINLAKGMNTLAKRDGIRWKVTTSRRTGAKAEKLLREHLEDCVIEDAIWWADVPRKELYSFMASSEVIFVTQDSVTMATEAVTSRRPVILIRPEDVTFPRNSFLPAYFQRLEENKRLERLEIAKLGNFNFRISDFHLIENDTVHSVATKLLNRLEFRRSTE